MTEDRIEVLEQALWRIAEWARAYPVTVFPEANADYLSRANDVLKGHGMSVDRISASAMRHVITQVEKIATDALGQAFTP